MKRRVKRRLLSYRYTVAGLPDHEHRTISHRPGPLRIFPQVNLTDVIGTLRMCK